MEKHLEITLVFKAPGLRGVWDIKVEQPRIKRKRNPKF